jgi:sec-independent protein translocase protein TatA
MPSLGGAELIIILIVVLLLFGVGRIGKLGEELGKGINAFRKGIREGNAEEEDQPDETTE